MKKIMLVLFLWSFLSSADCRHFALTHDRCLFTVPKEIKECLQLKNSYGLEKTIDQNLPYKKDKSKEPRSPRVQLEEDDLNSSKVKGNNSLIILALIIAVGYLNYYFKNRSPEFHFYNSTLGQQYLLLRVLRI